MYFGGQNILPQTQVLELKFPNPLFDTSLAEHWLSEDTIHWASWFLTFVPKLEGPPWPWSFCPFDLFQQLSQTKMNQSLIEVLVYFFFFFLGGLELGVQTCTTLDSHMTFGFMSRHHPPNWNSSFAQVGCMQHVFKGLTPWVWEAGCV